MSRTASQKLADFCQRWSALKEIGWYIQPISEEKGFLSPPKDSEVAGWGSVWTPLDIGGYTLGIPSYFWSEEAYCGKKPKLHKGDTSNPSS